MSFLILFLAVHLMTYAQAPSSIPNAGRLLALENAWNQAQIHHDAKAIESLLSEKFIYTDYDGTVMDKAKFLQDMQDPAYKASSVTNDDVRVDVYENAAVVSGTYHTKGTYKSKPFNHHGRFTDTWVYHNGLWQCAASHTTLLQK